MCFACQRSDFSFLKKRTVYVLWTDYDAVKCKKFLSARKTPAEVGDRIGEREL